MARPGVIISGADPQEAWRKNITGNTQDMKMLSLSAFSLNQQIETERHSVGCQAR